MVETTIQQLEEQLNKANLTAEQQQEVQNLLDTLKHELAQEPQNQSAVRQAFDGVQSTFQRFEQAHPGLTLTLDALSTYLARIGL